MKIIITNLFITLLLVACSSRNSDPTTWHSKEWFATEPTLSRLELVQTAISEVTGLPPCTIPVLQANEERVWDLGDSRGRPSRPDAYAASQVTWANSTRSYELTEEELAHLREVMAVIYCSRTWSKKGEPVIPVATRLKVPKETLADTTAAKVENPPEPPKPSATVPPVVVIDSRELAAHPPEVRVQNRMTTPKWHHVTLKNIYTGLYTEKNIVLLYGPKATAISIDGGTSFDEKPWASETVGGVVVDGDIFLLTRDGDLVSSSGFSYTQALDLPIIKAIARSSDGHIYCQTATKVYVLIKVGISLKIDCVVAGTLYAPLKTTAIFRVNGQPYLLNGGKLDDAPLRMPLSPAVPPDFLPTSAFLLQSGEDKSPLVIDVQGYQWDGDRFLPLNPLKPSIMLSHGGGLTFTIDTSGNPELQLHHRRHPASDSMPDCAILAAASSRLLIAIASDGSVYATSAAIIE